MTSFVTVPRHKVVEATRQIIKDCQVPAALADELIEIASTEPVLSANWDYDDPDPDPDHPDCGCLIGTYRMRRGLPATPADAASDVPFALEHGIGMAFYDWVQSLGADIIEVDDGL